MPRAAAVAIKSVKQRYYAPSISDATAPSSSRLLALMESFRQMTNDCMRLGLEDKASNSAPSLKRLSRIAYRELRERYDSIPSYYRLCAISKAVELLGIV